MTASIIETSPPSELKKKHGICNTLSQSFVCLFWGGWGGEGVQEGEGRGGRGR